MAKTEKPAVKAKANKAPKVAEKKTPKKVPLKKLEVVSPVVEEVFTEGVPTLSLSDGPVVTTEITVEAEMLLPDNLDLLEHPIKEKEPVKVLTPKQMEEKRLENHYASLGKIDYYHKHIKGK
jgi:hypothetical protein